MLPLVDTHCHLLAGLDDGPRSWEDAITMCRIAWEDGISAVAALAHQNEQYPGVSPDQIRAKTEELSRRLRESDIPLAVYPCAEVMVSPETMDAWRDGKLLSIADGGRYILIELPHGVFLDLRDLVSEFVDLGVRPILAHPERQPEILYGEGIVDELILRGCLMQVSASSITQDAHPDLAEGVRRWARRGVIHLVGSDGHSVVNRPPGISAAFHRLASWIGPGAAERICSANGMAVLEGLPLQTVRPQKHTRNWLSRLRGA
jgi:protein-tyrosine phosphatase